MTLDRARRGRRPATCGWRSRSRKAASGMLLGEIEIIGPEKPRRQPTAAAAALRRGRCTSRRCSTTPCWRPACSTSTAATPTDVLRDAAGQPCGIVMANRAGRQAVLAKTIIDATAAGRGRAAGRRQVPALPGRHAYLPTRRDRRRAADGRGPARPASSTPPFRGPYPNTAKTSSGEFQIIEYTLQLPVADDSYAACMRGRPAGPHADLSSRAAVHVRRAVRGAARRDAGPAVGRPGRGRAPSSCRWRRCSRRTCERCTCWAAAPTSRASRPRSCCGRWR